MGNTQTQLGEIIEIDGLLKGDREARDKLQQTLEERSYALFTLADTDKIESFHGITEDIHGFFTREQSNKDKLISEEGNVGYVLTTTREFLKLRSCDIGRYAGLMGLDENNANRALTNLAQIGWHSFVAMNNCSSLPLPEVELKDIKECLEERASLSVIHYFPATVSEAEDFVDEFPNAKDICDKVDTLKVCSQHKDTGIFTLILTSGVPGLEVYDKKLEAWIPLEKLVQPFRKLPATEVMVLLMGHKAPLFLGPKCQPTLHRVTVKQGVERPSFLYFMDTAKIN